MCDGRIFKHDSDSSTKDPKKFTQIDKFLQDFQSLFWFSYRKDFAPIAPSAYTSDMGWGCMLRSGQMLLAHVLALHFLGRYWGFSGDLPDGDIQISSVENKKVDYLQILRWFEDSPFPNVPYSVHQIAKLGIKYGKNIGEWFGPSTVSQVIGELVSSHAPSNLAIYVSNDSVLYQDEIESICLQNDESWKSLFILIPLRLGLDTLNQNYFPCLKLLFTCPYFVGFLGGKPRAAMYFVALQDDFVFYLDPHTIQPMIPMSVNTITVENQSENNGDRFSTQSFHCTTPQKMHLSNLDPSLALGFYCTNKKEFNDLWSFFGKVESN